MALSFAAQWKLLEGSGPAARRYRHLYRIDFEDFRRAVLSDRILDTSGIYRGNLFVLRRAFDPNFLRDLRDRARFFMADKPSSFHKMLDGSPDFHRAITPEEGKKYAFPCCKHSAYFYGWNDDPLGIAPMIYDRWRVLKLFMGHDATTYENNIPSDGVVDRIQVVRYPPGIGFLAPHVDPHLHQRLFLSVYMSKRGVDYHGGGFYVINGRGEKEFLEDDLEVGDMCIGYATVEHGVDPCYGDPDWNAADGRWFLSLYSNASDEVADRHTGRPVEVGG